MRKIILGLLLSIAVVIGIQITVLNASGGYVITPGSNTIGIERNANITVTFLYDIDEVTLTSTNIKIVGESSGEYSTTFSYDVPTKSLTIDPVNNFKFGEKIQVLITERVKKTGGEPVLPYVSEFRVKAEAVDGPFKQHEISTTADGAYSAFAVDIDNDNDIDVVSASFSGDKISWYENDGSGNVVEHIIIDIVGGVDGPRSVYSADIDNDGDMDVLSASSVDNTVAWYENKGGFFTKDEQNVITSSLTGVRTVHAADMDNDGDMDVLSASLNEDKIVWYENNNQVFIEHIIIDVPGGADGARAVYATDINNDGYLDVISASELDNTIAWYENNGGSFTKDAQNVITTLASGPYSVYAADLDNDGDMDILSASLNNDTVAWYENKGGTFTLDEQNIISNTADGAVSVYAADLDNDGDMDVISASNYDDKIAWYKNDNQVFSENVIIDVVGGADGAMSVCTADMDDDGDLDVISASSVDSTIAWYGVTTYKTTPDVNEIGVDYDTDIVITFPWAIDPATVTESTIVIVGENSGKYTYSSSYNASTKELTIDNTNDYKFGEIVRLYVTDQVKKADTTSVFPYSTEFVVKNEVLEGPLVQHNINSSAMSAYSVHTVDIDGDGDMDVLSASVDDDTVAWYENDGVGNLTEHIITDVAGGADGPTSVNAADLDNDGDMDVISSSIYDDAIIWFENNNQVFTEHIITDIGGGALGMRSIHIADLDSDGDMDVLSASREDDTIAWYENLGGTFIKDEKHIIIDTAAVNGRWDVYAADLDNDGDMDVLSASDDDQAIAWHENLGYNDTLGYAEFSSPNLIMTGLISARSVYAADLDNDGDMDVLSASKGDDSILWYENKGGYFTQDEKNIIIDVDGGADGAWDIRAVDFDSDGDMDVISASILDNTIAWYENKGGYFTQDEQNVITTSAGGAISIHTSDMDSDGDMDIISAMQTDNTIAWFGAATYKIVPDVSEIGVSYDADISITFPWAIDPNTINESTLKIVGENSSEYTYSSSYDALNKLVTINPTNNFLPGEVIRVYVTDQVKKADTSSVFSYVTEFRVKAEVQVGSYTKHQITTTSGMATRDVHAADIDNDGDIDVLSASGSDDAISWYENDGSGNLTEHVVGLSDGATSVYTADIDNDGDIDVLSGGRNDNRIAWYENLGFNQTLGYIEFSSRNIISSTALETFSVYAADMDNDGDMDVLSASQGDNTVAWYENLNGSFVLNSKNIIDNSAIAVRSVYAADIDSDGDMDVLSAGQNDNTIAWYENNNLVFTKKIITNTADSAQEVYAVDIDNDGDMDVLSASYLDDTIAWYENSNQLFTEHIIIDSIGGADGAWSVHAADVDNDGDMDVIGGSFEDEEVAWYENKGGFFTKDEQNMISTNSGGTLGVYAADIDSDGDLDIITGSYYGEKVEWFGTTTRYNITYNTESDQVINSVKYIEPGFTFLSNPSLLPSNPTKEGHTFTEWTDGSTSYAVDLNDFVMPSNNVTLTAVYTANTNTLTYYEQDGTTFVSSGLVDTDTLGTTLTPPAPASIAGYTHTGWTPDGGTTVYAVNLNDYTMATTDVDMVAVYTANTYTLTYYEQDGTTFVSSGLVDTDTLGTTLTPSVPASIAGYTHTEWTDGSTSYAVDLNDFVMPSNNVTLTAVYTANTNTLTYYEQDGTTFVSSGLVDTDTLGTTLTPPVPASIAGYTFHLVQLIQIH
ncbi:FG-GAP-like repeat-containing protein [Mycoplasmatota bacterium zrk1]